MYTGWENKLSGSNGCLHLNKSDFVVNRFIGTGTDLSLLYF